jgi:hypothetical protein
VPHEPALVAEGDKTPMRPLSVPDEPMEDAGPEASS